MPFGDGIDRLATLRVDRLPRHHRPVQRAIKIEVGAKGFRLFVGHQEIAGAGFGNGPDERGVQGGKFNFRHFGQTRGEMGINFFRCCDLRKVGAIFYRFEFNAVAAG